MVRPLEEKIVSASYSSQVENREYLAIFLGDVVAMHARAITNMTYITWIVTFLDPLVLNLCAGDLIGLSLLIFLQFLGVLHLFPFRLIQVALSRAQVMSCWFTEKKKICLANRQVLNYVKHVIWKMVVLHLLIQIFASKQILHWETQLMWNIF